MIVEGKTKPFYDTALSYYTDLEINFNDKMVELSNLSLFIDNLHNLSLFKSYKFFVFKVFECWKEWHKQSLVL